MKTFYIAFLTFFIFQIGTIAQTQTIHWQNTRINIDGENSDWKKPPRFYNSDLGILYEPKNDEQTLYLAYQVSNPLMQMKILSSGLQLNFKVNTKPKLKATIHFPAIRRERPENRSTQQPDFNDFKTNCLLLKDPAIAEGFRYQNGPVLPGQTKANAFTFAYNWSSANILFYEIAIPLKELFGENYDLKKAVQRTINIETKIIVMERPAGPSGKPDGNNMDRGMQSGRMQGGGMRGGGMQGGGSRGSMPSGGSSSQIQSFKQKIKLALNE